MPQVLKDEVRARILDGALVVFARDGFDAATMTSIANAAGVGAASIYRYYESKDELFDAVITPELTKRFEKLLERRVSGLARQLLRGERVDDAGDEMLQFWIENRLAVVVLLDRAAGTKHAKYGERFIELLTKHTVSEMRAASPKLQLAQPQRFVLRAIFENTRRLLASLLEQHAKPAELRLAIQTFWSYQIAGMRGLTTHLGG
jgi:AcrR family transcriptional regulator